MSWQILRAVSSGLVKFVAKVVLGAVLLGAGTYLLLTFSVSGPLSLQEQSSHRTLIGLLAMVGTIAAGLVLKSSLEREIRTAARKPTDRKQV